MPNLPSGFSRLARSGLTYEVLWVEILQQPYLRQMRELAEVEQILVS